VPSLAEKIRAQCLGLGVGFLPKHRIEDLLNQGDLVALPVANIIPTEALHIAWKTNNQGKVLHWFIEHLSQQFLLEDLS
ncbi:partial HTH-type transcriptional activator AllS, partial [uncultured bacterium]